MFCQITFLTIMIEKEHTAMNEILQKLIDTAPIYQDILQQDIAFSISDMEQYLYMLETDLLKFPFPVGTRIDAGGYEAVLNIIKSTKKPFINYVPKEITGTVPLKAIVAPIFDEDEMVGLFSVSISMDKEEKVSTTSERLTQSVEQVYGLIDTITNSADGLNNMMQSIQENVAQAVESIKAGNESISQIKKIAKQSGLLGLNAAIVSAKSGEDGKSFSVVAKEMQKLAADSTTISEQVVQSLNGIEESIKEILQFIEEAKVMAQSQYVETDNVRNNMKLISEQSIALVEYSKQED